MDAAVESTWELVERDARWTATRVRYLFRLPATCGDPRERIALELEMRNWSREDSGDVSVLSIDDFIPRGGLLIDPADRAALVLYEQSRALTSYGRPLAFTLLFLFCFAVASATLGGPFGTLVLCATFSLAFLATLLVIYVVEVSPGLTIDVSAVPAEVRLLRAAHGTLAEISIDASRYEHDPAVEERLRDDLFDLCASHTVDQPMPVIE
jgi:hypothetical protein